jgi:hypothetical protein
MSVPNTLKKTTATKKVESPPKKAPQAVETPLNSSSVKPIARECSPPGRPEKTENEKTSGIVANVFPATSVTVGRPEPSSEDWRKSARELHKIKRRLFLEAVKSDRPIRNKSPRNSLRQAPGKKIVRTGKE